jgi:hypothetical protein
MIGFISVTVITNHGKTLPTKERVNIFQIVRYGAPLGVSQSGSQLVFQSGHLVNVKETPEQLDKLIGDVMDAVRRPNDV